MLKQANRLLRKNDFDAVWKKGRSSYDKILGVKMIANNLTGNRFGIMVGLKVSKLAVERNKIKRRIREIIQADENNLKKGFDVVITVLPAARGLNFEGLKKSLLGNLKRLGVSQHITRNTALRIAGCEL
jgi:ribonuclease P protein component